MQCRNNKPNPLMISASIAPRMKDVQRDGFDGMREFGCGELESGDDMVCPFD